MSYPSRELMRNISCVEDMLKLPYFDFLAFFGEVSLHPGGPEATAELLSTAKVSQDDHVLEIGCGTGATTWRLIEAGARVTAADISPKMLSAAALTCERHGVPKPRLINASADDLDEVACGSVDVILCECVLGFVADLKRTVMEFKRVLNPETGRIALLDYHYRAAPPPEVLRQLSQETGLSISATTWEQRRESLASNFYQRSLKSFNPPQIQTPSKEQLLEGWRSTGLATEMSWFDEKAASACIAHWHTHESAFRKNRQYLLGHQAVFATKPAKAHAVIYDPTWRLFDLQIPVQLD